MKKNSQSGQLFWQTTLSIVSGVLIGLAIMSLTPKRAAQAGVQSTLPAITAPNIASSAVQILPMLSERMTVLIMGVDSNGRDTQRFTNTRSDTMILVNMDPIAHRVGVVSIPRDSRVQIAGNHGVDKINSAHAFGGAPLAMQTVSENFNVPVDHYVVVDTQALKELCNLLGPVEVLVEKEMHYTDWSAHLHIDLKPGLQTLSPEQVEQYVRFRHDARGDIGRIERQQWFFRAATKKFKDPQFLLRLPDLIRVAHDYVQTDLSLEDMARIATFAKDIKQQDVVTAMLPGSAEMINGGSYWLPDMDASRAVLNRVMGLANSMPITPGPRESLTASADGTDDAAPDSSNNGAYSAGREGKLGAGKLALARQVTSLSSSSSFSQNALALSSDSKKPIAVALKYCKASEPSARQLEALLNSAGYRVRYMWLNAESDCQHEQIVQNSWRADDSATGKLRSVCTDLNYWPVVLQLDPHPLSDFTIVVAPDTTFAIGSVSSSHANNRPVIPN